MPILHVQYRGTGQDPKGKTVQLQIDVVGSDNSIDVPTAIVAQLVAQEIFALIGRDFLQHCASHYNGISGAITLSI